MRTAVPGAVDVAGTTPSAPSSLQAISTTFTGVSLAWNPAASTTGVDGYRILVKGAWRTSSIRATAAR